MRLCLSFALALSSLVGMQAQEHGALIQNAVPVMMSDSSGSSSNVLVVRIRDKCDPPSFNLAINDPNACVGDGNVTFAQFIAELTEDRRVGDWRFNPDQTDATAGQQIRLESRGGETHTFTKVTEFNGGIVPFLNDLAGTPMVADGCQDAAHLLFVAPGDVILLKDPTLISSGKASKFQCCIHPWMHLTVNATGK